MDGLARLAVFAALVPGALGASGALLARVLRAGTAGRPAVLAASLASALITAHLGVAGLPRVPPVDTLGWIPFVSAAAFLALVPLERWPDRLHAPALALCAGLGAGAAYLVGAPAWRQGTATSAALGLVVAGAAAALGTALLDRAARRLPVWSVLLSLFAAVSGAALVCLFSHSALLATLLGATAAALAGLAGLGALLRSLAPARSALAVVVLTTAAQLVYARLYSQLPAGALALAGLAMVAPVAATILPGRARGRPLLAVALAVLLAGAAVAFAYAAVTGGEGADAGPSSS